MMLVVTGLPSLRVTISDGITGSPVYFGQPPILVQSREWAGLRGVCTTGHTEKPAYLAVAPHSPANMIGVTAGIKNAPLSALITPRVSGVQIPTPVFCGSGIKIAGMGAGVKQRYSALCKIPL